MQACRQKEHGRHAQFGSRPGGRADLCRCTQYSSSSCSGQCTRSRSCQCCIVAPRSAAGRAAHPSVGTLPTAACAAAPEKQRQVHKVVPQQVWTWMMELSGWSGCTPGAATGVQSAELRRRCWQQQCGPLPAAHNPLSTAPPDTHHTLPSSCRAQRAPLLALLPRPCVAAHRGPGLLLGAKTTTLECCLQG